MNPLAWSALAWGAASGFGFVLYVRFARKRLRERTRITVYVVPVDNARTTVRRFVVPMRKGEAIATIASEN